MNKLQRFFSDNWTIRRHDLENTVSLLLPCIIAGNIEAAVAQLSKDKCTVRATAAPYMAKWYELDDITLPIDSIAVITLTGTLYSWESEWVIKQVEAATLNPNICGIVFVIDGPGGMVSHLDMAAAAIENCEKPTASVVTGVMASAHFWLGTALHSLATLRGRQCGSCMHTLQLQRIFQTERHRLPRNLPGHRRPEE